MKDIRKCDSVKVAFNEKTTLLHELIDSNLQMFNDLEIEKKNRIEISKNLEQVNKDLIKSVKRNKNTLIYTSGGIVLGFIVKSILK